MSLWLLSRCTLQHTVVGWQLSSIMWGVTCTSMSTANVSDSQDYRYSCSANVWDNQWSNKMHLEHQNQREQHKKCPPALNITRLKCFLKWFLKFKGILSFTQRWICRTSVSNVAELTSCTTPWTTLTAIIDKICIILYKTRKTGVHCGGTGGTCFRFIQSC